MKKKFRMVYVDGSNGWRLGEIVEIEEPIEEAVLGYGLMFWSRNEDGLYVDRDEGHTLLVPID